jgi:hypothetical protein
MVVLITLHTTMSVLHQTWCELKQISGFYIWFVVVTTLAQKCKWDKPTRNAARPPLQFAHCEFWTSIALALTSEWEEMGVR